MRHSPRRRCRPGISTKTSKIGDQRRQNWRTVAEVARVPTQRSFWYDWKYRQWTSETHFWSPVFVQGWAGEPGARHHQTGVTGDQRAGGGWRGSLWRPGASIPLPLSLLRPLEWNPRGPRDGVGPQRFGPLLGGGGGLCLAGGQAVLGLSLLPPDRVQIAGEDVLVISGNIDIGTEWSGRQPEGGFLITFKLNLHYNIYNLFSDSTEDWLTAKKQFVWKYRNNKVKCPASLSRWSKDTSHVIYFSKFLVFSNDSVCIWERQT